MTDFQIVVFFNLLISLFAMWFGACLVSQYRRLRDFEKYRFKLFALRDDLSLLIMRGEIIEQSNEHVTLLRMINSAISSTEKFSASSFTSRIAKMVTDPETRRRIDKMCDDLKAVENPAFASIVSRFYGVVLKNFNRQMNPARRIMLSLGSYFKIKDIERREKDFAKFRMEAEQYKDNFAKLATN